MCIDSPSLIAMKLSMQARFQLAAGIQIKTQAIFDSTNLPVYEFRSLKYWLLLEKQTFSFALPMYEGRKVSRAVVPLLLLARKLM